jgi:hypothetical protein
VEPTPWIQQLPFCRAQWLYNEGLIAQMLAPPCNAAWEFPELGSIPADDYIMTFFFGELSLLWLGFKECGLPSLSAYRAAFKLSGTKSLQPWGRFLIRNTSWIARYFIHEFQGCARVQAHVIYC